MPVAVFPTRVYPFAFFVLLTALFITIFHRAEHFDDAWFAEQSYWLVRDGWVRSEFFRGYNGWENRIYVFHKLFIYAGALIMRVTGFTLAGSKLLTSFCGLITGWLIWHYNHRYSREQQWLSVILFFGCGSIIRYFAINRPEMMCMTLGFGSYLALDRPTQKSPHIVLSAGLAGLAALTHLNGVVYLVVGTLWLLIKLDWRAAGKFALVGGLTLGLYLVDAVADGQLHTLIAQFANDPATQSNFKLADKLTTMLNYHQLFFHSHGEVPLSVLTLLCLLMFRRTVTLAYPVFLYLVLLVGTFWVVTKSNFDFYYILFVPWLVLTLAHYLATYLPASRPAFGRIWRGLLMLYAVAALFSIGKVLEENVAMPYLPTYNATLASHMPQRQTKVIAPISFFFGQMDNYNIQGSTYYVLLEKKGEKITLPAFFQQAATNKVKYIISNFGYDASYVIPPDAPANIGSYHRIFQDQWGSIHEWRE